ncbi:MAG: hypothetical protein WA633_23190 [Stellaceae bacterium]
MGARHVKDISGSERNYTNYCNPELEKMYAQQSMEPDQKSAQESGMGNRPPTAGDAARPIIYHYPTRHLPLSAGARIAVMVNSIFNGWRFDDAWFDQ